jgi:hypothetical protein
MFVIMSEKVRDLHNEAYTFWAGIIEKLKKGKYSLQDKVDLGFLFRELEDTLEDWRKSATAYKKLTERLIGLEVTSQSLNDAEPTLKAEGSLASAAVDLKIIAVVPKRGTKEYNDLCESQGIPEELRKCELIKFDFKKVCDLAVKCAESGQPLPKGIEKTYPEFTATFRRKGLKYGDDTEAGVAED